MDAEKKRNFVIVSLTVLVLISLIGLAFLSRLHMEEWMAKHGEQNTDEYCEQYRNQQALQTMLPNYDFEIENELTAEVWERYAKECEVNGGVNN